MQGAGASKSRIGSIWEEGFFRSMSAAKRFGFLFPYNIGRVVELRQRGNYLVAGTDLGVIFIFHQGPHLEPDALDDL